MRECVFQTVVVFTDVCKGQAMSDAQVPKVVARRRDALRKRSNFDIAHVMQTVTQTLETARVCSLQPTAAETLTNFVEAWQHEYFTPDSPDSPDSAVREAAVRLLCGQQAEPPSLPG